MKPHPRIWALVSLLLFIAAGYFWHLGNQRAAHQFGSPAATNDIPPGAKPAAAFPQEAFRIVSGPPAPAAPAPSATTAFATNRFRYRLTNSPESFNQLVHNERAVLLRNALLDTGLPGQPVIPERLRTQGDPESYIVQARGVITPAFRQALKDAGAEVVSYVPNNAYLVRASGKAAGALAALPLTQSVLPFEPYYKLEPKLLAQSIENQPLPDGSLLNVMAFPGQRDRAVAALTGAGATVMQEERSVFGPLFVVQTRGSSLAALAQLPAVQVIEQYRERRPANDLARVRLGVSTNTIHTAAAYSLPGVSGPLTGNGVVVQVADTGVWADHPDLTALRVFGDTNDVDGHGTHVAGTIASSGAHSPTVISQTNGWSTNVPGSTNGANFRGMAPDALILSTHAMGFNSDEALQRAAALSTNGPLLICNNSWTYGNPDYDLHAASFDAATRDALLGITGPQPLLFVFAAGDYGGGQNDGQGGQPDTVASPGTAKNAITVGAVEQLRLITNLVTEVVLNGMDLSTNDYAPWLGMTDSSNEVAHFSSRGNTGITREGNYGRFKPDVVAPGAMLVSCSISNIDYGRMPTTYTLSRLYQGVFTRPHTTNHFSQTIGIPTPYLISFDVTCTPNAASPTPWPGVPMMMSMNNRPPPADATGVDTVGLGNPPLANGIARWTVENTTDNNLTFDMLATLVITNFVLSNSYPVVLSNLNNALDPSHLYRYEWGSSMAAASVSGTLALMQEYFTRDLGLTNESPALMKALLINGSRNLSTAYDFDAHVKANKQGWGLVSLPSTLPASPASAGSTATTQFVDQDATNSLPTGYSHTRIVTVNPASSRSPLRITLTWTDPAANPLAGIKLVNDLDLIVTNLANPSEVYVGNYLAEGSIYSQPIGLTVLTNGGASTTNLQATNFNAALDLVDNVENVFVPPPLSAQYSVTVRARRVNVNAVDAADPSTVAQDYALVTSVGSLITNNSGLTFTATPTIGTDTNPVVKTYNTNFVVLVHERVGANPPYLVTSNGLPEQWNFYVFSNATTFTNVAFLTFTPLHVGFLQPNQSSPSKPRYHVADLDLYVSQNFGLTNLDPLVMSLADRSVTRGGSELVVYTNAAPGAIYYVGIKSEDQQAADYSFFALASQMPFSQMNSNGSQEVQGFPVEIPDGSPESPGGTTVVAIAMFPMTIQRVTAEVKITHQLAGDLTGNLSHTATSDAGGEQAGWVMLNNHRVWYGPDDTLYDDSKQGDMTNAIPADGPDSLNSFMGMEAAGVWSFDVVDNALEHTGRVEALTITIDPLNDTNLLGQAYSRRIGAGGWLYAVVDVPADATNLQVCVTSTGGAVDLYLRRGDFPTLTDHDLGLTNTTGGCLNWSILDPFPPGPLQPGRYYIGVYNFNSTAVDVTLTVEVQRQFRPTGLITYVSTNATPLLDDALTNAIIHVTNHAEVAMVQVGVRIEHERASDLVLHLISPPTAAYPKGLRLLLAENRGWTNTNGYGASITNILTNFVSTLLKDGFEFAVGNSNYVSGSNVSGWTVSNGPVVVLTAGGLLDVVVDTGTNCLDLLGGTVTTNLVTRAGTNYLVTFAYTRNPASSGQPEAEVRVAGSNQITLQATDINTEWTNAVWHHTGFVFQATGPATLLEVASTAPSAPDGHGVVVDSFRVQQVEITTNFYRYTVFTEDPAKAHRPIKFGEPPWANTNLLFTNLLLGSFETATAGTYDTNSVPFEGWRVVTNKASVVTDPTLAYDGTNFLALGSGEVAYNLPTMPDAEYRITFAYRGPEDVAWWPFYVNPPDDIVSGIPALYGFGTVPPALVNAKVNRGVGLDGFNQYVEVPFADFSPKITFGADFGLTIETWIYPTNVDLAQPLVEWNSGLGDVGANFWISVAVADGGGGPGSVTADLVDTLGGTHPITSLGGLVSAGEFHHVAVTYQAWNGDAALYLDGVQVATKNLGLFTPSTYYDLYFGLRYSGPGGGMFQGVLDEVSFYNRALSEAEIYAIFHADTVGKWDALTPMPNFSVLAPGLFTNTVVASTNWNIYTMTFVATDTNTSIRFAGHPLGVLIDQVEVFETGNKFYLPEESLAPMFGQFADGDWQLEIWDNRLGGGQITNAFLRSWELQLGFVRSNATPVYLTNHLVFNGTVLYTNLMFFIVDAFCTNGGTVVHTLNSDYPVDLLFNRFGFPTTVPGDATLLSAVTNGTNVIAVGGLLLPQPGRYYLAVRNTDPAFDATFTLQADVTCMTNGFLGVRIGSAGLSYSAGGLQMQWYAPRSSSFLVQYADSLDAPVWTTVPRVITSSSGVFTYSDDHQTRTAAVATNRFYRLIQLPP